MRPGLARVTMLDAFRDAVTLYDRLEHTPRWRPRRRRRLAAELDVACRRADRARATLGASTDATPLRAVLAQAAAARGGTVTIDDVFIPAPRPPATRPRR